MKRPSFCLVCLLGLVSGQVLRAEPAVVIGTFSSLENATALQSTAADNRRIAPMRDVRVVQTQRDGQLLHRVVLLPLGPGDARALQQTAQGNGYADAWLADVEVEVGAAAVGDNLGADPFLAAERVRQRHRDADPQKVAPANQGRSKPLLPLYRNGEEAVQRDERSWRPSSRQPKGDTSLTFRLKGFASTAGLPVADFNRSNLGSRRKDGALDFRTMLQHDVGNWSLELAHSALVQYGKGLSLGQLSGEQIVVSDDLRLMNLTADVNDGSRHRSLHRFDRLNAQWRSDRWAVTVGRQAVSWGSGIVFQPLDPFNPFAPTAVDRDYKAGDDLVLVERLFDNGHDAQLLHVFRRNAQDSVSSEVASTAAKWHGYAGLVEFELIVAQHYDTEFFGVSGRIPVGPAVLRSDIAMRHGISQSQQNDDWGVLGIVNIDVAFPWRNRTVYAFAEYFHNDFGLTELPSPLTSVPLDLQAGLSRGEFFNLMRDYLAVGGSFEWHPLLTQQLTVITNLHDSSSLLQMQFAYDVGQNQNMQLGWIGSTGGSGDEFAPISVGALPTGQPITQGGGDRIYLRWAGYF